MDNNYQKRSIWWEVTILYQVEGSDKFNQVTAFEGRNLSKKSIYYQEKGADAIRFKWCNQGIKKENTKYTQWRI